MISARWCPLCQGAKAPSEAICIGCGVTRENAAAKCRMGCGREVFPQVENAGCCLRCSDRLEEARMGNA